MEIEGYSNYLIYPDGRVQNKKTKRFLKHQLNKHRGYYQVELWKNNKRYMFRVHRLLAIHFIPNPYNLECVDHINRNKLDNRLENLRWCNKENNSHNTTATKNSKSGIKNIHRHSQVGYNFTKTYKKKQYHKWFSTLEEAIEYRYNFINNLNDEFVI